MTVTNKDKRSIDDTWIRELLQENGSLHDKNNETVNRVYKEEYEMTIDSYARKSIPTDSTIN